MTLPLNEAFKNYYEQYKLNKLKKVKMDVIKSTMKTSISKDKMKAEDVLKKHNLIYREVHRKKYIPKKESYEFFDDLGLLPLVVNIPKGLEKEYNLDKAKVNFKESISVHPGRKKIVDTDGIRFDLSKSIENASLAQLSNLFNDSYSETKLEERKMEKAKQDLLESMKKENTLNLSTDEMGTIKYRETYDYDPFILYEFVSGKKEIFLKNNETNYDVIIVPDNKKGKLPKDFKIMGKELMLYEQSDPLLSSNFIKKREFNKLLKEGYKAFAFEVPIDPNEFFYKLPISRTKVLKLVDNGTIKEKEVEELFEVDEGTNTKPSIQIIPAGVAEKQRDLFFERLMERAKNLREKDSTNVDNIGMQPEPLVNVKLDDFSF